MVRYEAASGILTSRGGMTSMRPVARAGQVRIVGSA
jgi:hypothetical protein